MPPADLQPPNDFAAAVNDVANKASVLVREEIELAKAEVQEKATSLAKGSAVGIAAGTFIAVGLLFLLEAIAWLLYALFFDDVFWGFLIVAGALFIAGGLAGWIASRALKAGAPPTPDMAIAEAREIRATVEAFVPSSDGPSMPVNGAAAPAGAAAPVGAAAPAAPTASAVAAPPASPTTPTTGEQG